MMRCCPSAVVHVSEPEKREDCQRAWRADPAAAGPADGSGRATCARARPLQRVQVRTADLKISSVRGK
eukprot:6601195-Alexandrium_andersonii.AAC.1